MEQPAHLLICLHDAGTDGGQFAEAAGVWRSLNPGLRILCPDAPEPFDVGDEGKQWYSLDDIGPDDWDDRVEAGARRAADAIAAAQERTGVAPEHTLVAGFSQGAAVLIRLADRLGSSAFSRMLLFSAQPEPGGWQPAQPDRWPETHLFHGETDDVVPLELARELFKRLYRSGIDVSLFVDNLSPHLMGKATIMEAGMRISRILSPTH